MGPCSGSFDAPEKWWYWVLSQCKWTHTQRGSNPRTDNWLW